MIKTIIKRENNFCETVYMSVRELVSLKKLLHENAIEFLKQNSEIEHIIYYADERNNDGEITLARLYYCMLDMDEETFFNRTKNYAGYIGAVHRR